MSKQYEMAFQIGAKVQGNFSSAFKNAASSVQGLQTQIESLNKKQSDITGYQKAQQAIEKTRQKLQLYQQQYANLKAEMDRNGQASAAEQNALLAKGKAIDDQKDKLAQLESKLASTGAALEKEGIDLNNLAEISKQTGQDIDLLKQKQLELAESSTDAGNSVASAVGNFQEFASAIGVAEGLSKVMDMFKQCTQEAMAFENEMAAVRRTVGGDSTFISDLGDSFKEISTEIPIAKDELAQIAATAGQLGVSAADVETFTVVMAKLATTTDLSADEAATMLAQFANITGVTDYERLGAVIAELGDSTATTASKVVEMSQGMAASASLAGMSSTDIMAISAAIGSLGIEAQAGSTAMSQLINTLYKATETGDNLSEFAAVAGMTAQQFKQAWATDAVGAMNAFITGLNDVERNGRSAIVILDELGISNVRQQKAVLGLASAGDLLANTITQANSAWEQNTALEEKAGIMYETTQAKVTMMQNAFSNLGVSIGDAFLPVIGDAAEALNGIISPIAQFIEENPALVKAIGAAAGVIGTVTAAMAAYTIAAKVAAAASAAFSGALPVMAITAGIALVTGLAVGLSDSANEAAESVENLNATYNDLMYEIENQNKIIDLCDDYKNLSKQIDFSVDASKKLKDFNDIDITLEATATQSIEPSDFMIDEDTQVELSAMKDPQSLIDAGEFINEGSNIIMLHPSTDDSEKIDPESKMMTGTGVKLHVDKDGSVKIDADALVNGSTAIQFTASWANLPEMQEEVEALKKQAEEAKSELYSGREILSDMQKYAEELNSRLLHAKTPAEKDSLKKQLEELNSAILQQEENVGLLESAYNEVGGKYVIAANAAETLIARDEELARIQATLGINTSGAAESIDQETQAILDNIAAKEQEALIERNRLKGLFMGSIGEKAEWYYEKTNGDAAHGNMYSTDWYQRNAANAQSGANYAGTWIGKDYQDFNKEFENTLYAMDAWMSEGNTDNEYFAANLQKLQTMMLMSSPNTKAGIGFSIDEDTQLYDSYLNDPKAFMEKWKGINFHDLFYSDSRKMHDPQDLANSIAMAYNYASSSMETAEQVAASQQKVLDDLVEAVLTGAVDDVEEVEAVMTAALSGHENAADTVAQAMDYVREKVAQAAAEASNAADGTDQNALKVQQAVQPIIDQINELSEAYNQAYDAAYQSISGQFKLFEEMELAQPAKNAQKEVDGYIDALMSQQAYMEQYMTNLAAVKDMGVSDALIAQLSDGSKESAEILANIVEGGATKIDQLNDAFEGVETGKQQFADTVAEMETDFTEKMKMLEEQLTTTVEQMNQSEAAAAAGADTMQAFADAAAGKQSAVESAFEKVRNAAIRKLMGGINFPGFAGGTNYAPEGFAMVGENGPELVYLHGGEKILDAQETQRTMEAMSVTPINAMSNGYGSGSYIGQIVVSPEFTISGGGNLEGIEDLIDRSTEKIRGIVIDTMEDYEVDRKRMAYV